MKNALMILGLLWAVGASGQIYIDSYRFAQTGGFDADYQAVLNYATSQGYTLPSAGQQIIQNQLVSDLKAAGVWAKLDVLYVFANDGGQDFATLNWKNPSAHQATLVNSPVFTSNVGFTGNATNAYIDTNFNPATQGVNYTLNDAGRFGYYSARPTTGANFFEGNASGISTTRTVNSTNTQQFINSGILNATVTFVEANPWRAINRTSSVDVVLFTSVNRFDRTSTSTTVQSFNQFIMRSGGGYSAHTVNFYAMGGALVAENDTFRDLITNYMTSL